MERFDPRNRKPRAKRRLLLVAGVLAAIAASNILALRDEPFVPPSQFYFTASFSARFALAQAAVSDVLIFGNSRVRSGLSPQAVGAAAADAGAPQLRVRTLADAGGFPAFYDAAFDLVRLNTPLPRAVILGVSPRDLDEGDRRKREPAADLIASSGYRLAHLPYNSVFASLERTLVDAVAALLPGLYERERVVGAFVPSFVSQAIFVDLGETRVGQVLQLWMRRFLGQAEGAWLDSPDQWLARWAAWKNRVAALSRASNEPALGRLDADGGELPDPPETAQIRVARVARVEAVVLQAKARGEGRVCRSELAGTTLDAFVEKLVGQGIVVFLVQPPALYLEPCEMRAIEDGRFARTMAQLTARHGPNVRFLDLMGDAGSELRDPIYFGDSDHMVSAGADRVGRTVGAWVGPFLR